MIGPSCMWKIMGVTWRLSFWGSSASCASRISGAKQTWVGICGPTRARGPIVVHIVTVPWLRKETWRLISRMSTMRRTIQYNQRESMSSASMVNTPKSCVLARFQRPFVAPSARDKRVTSFVLSCRDHRARCVGSCWRYWRAPTDAQRIFSSSPPQTSCLRSSR